MARKEIKSEITGSLWKIVKQPGESVTDEDTLMILESMKMEIPIMAEASGTLAEILVKEGDPVAEGQVVAVIETP
ncbi:MAG: biotin/lipoyl-binding carrier protein [Pseudomonadota bacterium]|nr:biotin/lipoyl-binding carrier protein [Pseudomonadota bacterium]